MQIAATKRGSRIDHFTGFAAPTSNTTYCPNQFFDVCLPHYSRGVVRIVAYMIRKTLGWCDELGNPQQEAISFSYSELEKNAGIGHSAVRQALEEAARGGFIRCVRAGKAKTQRDAGNAAIYVLVWDENRAYIKDPAQFKGFFAGEGNRTYIPNQYFDQLIPTESLALIQVVGTIIRFSIGFANKFGHRRQRVALSYFDIQRYSKIASPRIVSKAIKEAKAKNYIERVEQGYFDPNGGMLSRAGHYALKWADSKGNTAITPKSEAGKNRSEKFSGIAPKSEAADGSKKPDSMIRPPHRWRVNSHSTGWRGKSGGLIAGRCGKIGSACSGGRSRRTGRGRDSVHRGDRSEILYWHKDGWRGERLRKRESGLISNIAPSGDNFSVNVQSFANMAVSCATLNYGSQAPTSSHLSYSRSFADFGGRRRRHPLGTDLEHV